MLWAQGVSTGLWQEEGFCSATVVFSLLGSPQPQLFFPKHPYQGGPHRDTKIGESLSESHPRQIDPIQQSSSS